MEKCRGENLMDIKRGEIYYVDLEPVRGSEMKKDRPAVIVSRDAVNRVSAVVIICPITDAYGKTSTMHVPVFDGQGGLKKDSIVHCGQVRAIDKEERIGNKIGDMPSDIMIKIEAGLKWVMELN